MSELHGRIETLADLFIAGALDEGDRTNLEAHAAGCASCAAVLSDARAFASWARGSMSPDAPPADLEDRIIAAFRRAVPEKRQWIRNTLHSRWIKVIGWGAAAACMISIGGVFSGEAGRSATPESEVAVMNYDLRYSGGDPKPGTLSWSAPGDEFKNSYAIRTAGIERARGYIDANKVRLGLTTAGDLEEMEKEKAEQPGNVRRNAERRIDQSLRKLDDSIGDKAQKQGGENALKGDAKDYLFFDGAEGEAGGKSGTGGGSMTGSPADVVQDTRKIIRNGQVDMEVDSYEKAQAKINEIVAAEKGQVAGADTTRLANGKIQAIVTLRIPPERFEAVLAKLRELGTVRRQSIGSQDVTKAYMDLDLRLNAKQALLERLKKLLAEAQIKGTVKEFMEVEVQIGSTVEQIEQIKGELKYFDNLVGMATITMTLSEKDLGQPFEYVQTLRSNIGITATEIDDVYDKAKKVVLDAGGQVVESHLTRQNDGSSNGTVQGKVDAEKFTGVREALRRLGHVDNDTVNVQQTARGGGEESSRPGAPVRKEQALVVLSLKTPPVFISQSASMRIETEGVKNSFDAFQKAVEAKGGRITNSGFSTPSSDQAVGNVSIQIDIAKFQEVLDAARAIGKVKEDSVSQTRPTAGPDGTIPLVREQGGLSLSIGTPPRVIEPDQGISKLFRDTIKGSITGVMWSIEKLFVGIALAGPWLLLVIPAFIIGRRILRKRQAPPTTPA